MTLGWIGIRGVVVVWHRASAGARFGADVTGSAQEHQTRLQAHMMGAQRTLPAGGARRCQTTGATDANGDKGRLESVSGVGLEELGTSVISGCGLGACGRVRGWSVC